MKAVQRRFIVSALTTLLAVVLLSLAVGVPQQAHAQSLGDASCRLEWKTPTKYENGADLDPQDIGGFEVRIDPPDGDMQFKVINDPQAGGIHVEDCQPGEYQFSIAAFLTNGIYSEFVPITEVAGDANRPGVPTDFRFYEEYPTPGCDGRPGDCLVIEMSSQIIIYTSD